VHARYALLHSAIGQNDGVGLIPKSSSGKDFVGHLLASGVVTDPGDSRTSHVERCQPWPKHDQGLISQNSDLDMDPSVT
jgi:hypothetical protein